MQPKKLNVKDAVDGMRHPTAPSPTATSGNNRFALPYTWNRVCHGILGVFVSQCGKRGRELESEEVVRRRIRMIGDWMMATGQPDSLLLIGNVGSGKTTLAEAVAMYITTATQATHGFQRAVGHRVVQAKKLAKIAKDDPSLFDEICSLPLLVLDDIGIEPTEGNSYGNITTPVSDVIFERHATQRPTIFTSNLPLPDLAEKYGERIADRLREMCVVISFNESTYR